MELEDSMHAELVQSRCGSTSNDYKLFRHLQSSIVYYGFNSNPRDKILPEEECTSVSLVDVEKCIVVQGGFTVYVSGNVDENDVINDLLPFADDVLTENGAVVESDTYQPSETPSHTPSVGPSGTSSTLPSDSPSSLSSYQPSGQPSSPPTNFPSKTISLQPSDQPSQLPSSEQCIPRAQKVKIQTLPGQYLKLFDVQIYSSSSGSNLAIGKTANQSTTLEDGTSASEAINQDEYLFSQTRHDDPHSWWEVDIGSTYEIKTIYIGLFSCRHGPENDIIWCYCHLGGANITLLDYAGESVANYTMDMVCAKRHIINFDRSNKYCAVGPSTSPSVN